MMLSDETWQSQESSKVIRRGWFCEKCAKYIYTQHLIARDHLHAASLTLNDTSWLLSYKRQRARCSSG